MIPALLLAFDWRTTPWTRDDKDVAVVWARLERLAEVRPRRTAAARLRAECDLGGDKGVARYRRYYSAFLATKLAYGATYGVPFGEAKNALQDVPADSYEWTRLRYLVRTLGGLTDEDRDLGERLLRRDPNDYFLYFALIYQSRPHLSPEIRKRCLELCDELVRRFPDRAGSHSERGFNYRYSGIRYRNWEWLEIGAKETEIALQMVEPDNPGIEEGRKELARARRKLKARDWNVR